MTFKIEKVFTETGIEYLVFSTRDPTSGLWYFDNSFPSYKKAEEYIAFRGCWSNEND